MAKYFQYPSSARMAKMTRSTIFHVLLEFPRIDVSGGNILVFYCMGIRRWAQYDGDG